jgi:D-serine deaminase-like pyridoxal phosphate-dependent protein
MTFKAQTKFLKELGVEKPTILIDEDKVKANIIRIKNKADQSKVVFRPHFKTHQSIDIGNIFKALGIKTITVSSLEMANYFAEAGWIDITVAVPANPLEIIEIKKLSQKVNLSILVDHPDTIALLKAQLHTQVKVFIKIDTGYGRAGVPVSSFEIIEKMVQDISNCEYLFFQGLLTHAGNTYATESHTEIREIFQNSIKDLNQIKQQLKAKGFDNCLLSVGDTPACSIIDEFNHIDEIRPGNCSFYDLVQENLNVCSPDNIAVTVACPVIGKYPERKEIIIYGGAIHFSKDAIQVNDNNIFGYLAPWKNKKWKGIDKETYIYSLSQEHGKVKLPEHLFQEIRIGDILTFYPVHSCLTAHAHRHYLSLTGKKIPKM